MLPAHQTKHLPVLYARVGPHTFRLRQAANGDTNGSALWLGGQLLAAHLLELHATGKLARTHRAIELGAGIGLCGYVCVSVVVLIRVADAHRLTLATLGVDVVATDVPLVLPILSENLDHNIPLLPLAAGSVVVRELDWTVLPENWSWTHPLSIASQGAPTSLTDESSAKDLSPPFDLIITADTLYHDELVAPLLRTLHHLVLLSPGSKCLLALERRDPALIDRAIAAARQDWAFTCSRVPPRRLAKAMARAGLEWAKEDWDGVELWELSLPVKKASSTRPTQSDNVTLDK
jgi:predicted nicotinamide N-methyase